MKKIILFVAVVSAFSFASCKKDHTCTCSSTTSYTSTEPGYSETPDAGTDMFIATKSKKGDAKKMCIDSKETRTNEYQAFNTATGTLDTYTRTSTDATTCTLK